VLGGEVAGNETLKKRLHISSGCCFNKSSQIYHPTVLEVPSQMSFLAKIKVSAEMCPFSRLWGENLLPCLSSS
jgi:hypothetical protein